MANAFLQIVKYSKVTIPFAINNDCYNDAFKSEAKQSVSSLYGLISIFIPEMVKYINSMYSKYPIWYI